MRSFKNKIEVPCNGCTLCCQGDIIRLDHDENPQQYQTRAHPFISGARMLEHKPNGECIYLESGGCSIHDRAPLLCRMGDCRIIASKYNYETARQFHELQLIDIRVWDHGRLLLEKMK